jgi:hypothetical protein
VTVEARGGFGFANSLFCKETWFCFQIQVKSVSKTAENGWPCCGWVFLYGRQYKRRVAQTNPKRQEGRVAFVVQGCHYWDTLIGGRPTVWQCSSTRARGKQMDQMARNSSASALVLVEVLCVCKRSVDWLRRGGAAAVLGKRAMI